MKIKKYKVVGLNGHVNFDFDFHDDINIFTGLNGSGKTTAMKLAWYVISGSTVRVRTEIQFKECHITTDSFSVSLERPSGQGDIKFVFSGETNVEGSFSEVVDVDSDGDPILDGEDQLRDLIREVSERSIFFPTFRRIEGGYSIAKIRRARFTNQFIQSSMTDSSLGAQLEQISKDLSYDQHKFVCAVSTEDVSALLTQRYAQVSEGVNKKYAEFSSEILRDIRAWEQGVSRPNVQSDDLLLRIQAAANHVDSYRDTALKPFDVLGGLIGSLFSYQGVRLKTLTLGDAAKAIDSDILSAGEKQMLSFLVYNAFSRDTPIFIDEPELSLHPDWQRRLLPMLLEQQASNQFIVSTHSPFIYSKYGDKELAINQDRGN